MNSIKAKEPWLGVFFSYLFPGLGQIYAKRGKRGIIYILVTVVLLGIAIHGLYILVSPNQIFTKNFIITRIILVLLLGLFCLYVLLDSFLCVRKFNINHKVKPTKISVRIMAIIGIVILIYARGGISTYIKNNIIQAYKIPTGTMSPTLEIGDRIFVDKRAYLRSKPKRGDVVVFGTKNIPGLDGKTYMKRIAGLPQETIEIKNGKILINGKEIGSKFKYYNDGDYGKKGQKIEIPIGYFYVLGDNSFNSKDSRYFGFVPEKDINGKACKIWWPLTRIAKID